MTISKTFFFFLSIVFIIECHYDSKLHWCYKDTQTTSFEKEDKERARVNISTNPPI